MVDRRRLPLGTYLVLKLHVFPDRCLLRVVVLKAVYFIFYCLLCLFRQFALTSKLVLEPLLLLLLVFTHFQDFPLHLSSGAG